MEGERNMKKRACALLLAGLMTVSLCACRGEAVEKETQAPSPEPTASPTENAGEMEVFHTFLRGESEAVVGDDFTNDLVYVGYNIFGNNSDFAYDAWMGAESMSVYDLNKLVKDSFDTEGLEDVPDTTASYALLETMGGRPMLVMRYDSPTGMDRFGSYFVFGAYDGQLRLTYAKDTWSRSYTELRQGLIFSGGGSSGAGHHHAWCGFINENGYYQAVYEEEILSGEWVAMDAYEVFELDDIGWSSDCVCYLLTTEEGSFYDLDAMEGADLADVDPGKLALLRKHYQDRGLTEVEDASAVIAEAEAAHGIQETPIVTDWTPISMPAEETPIEAYQQALWRLLEEHISLDGYHFRDDEWDVEDFAFAISDVDMDGEAELIAQMDRNTCVYGYERKQADLTLELVGGIRCRFYDNATAQLDSNHQTNGLAGRFWPYDATKYEEETGEYRSIGSVDAFDLEIMKEVGAESVYPQEIDVEEAGFVYYVTRDGKETAMTQSEYDAWYEGIFGGAEEIEVDYRPLTQENINNGCARAAYEVFLAGDMSLLEPVEPGWAEHMASWLDFLCSNGGIEYTYLDLDGDGVDELLLQCPDDPQSYNGVFHYVGGELQCWQDDGIELSRRDYPLRDGTMVSQYRECYYLFRYQPDGSKRELISLSAMPRHPEEDIYFYQVDGEDVDQAEFEGQLKRLVTDQLLEREAWRLVSPENTQKK